jgi:hypothetical protein
MVSLILWRTSLCKARKRGQKRKYLAQQQKIKFKYERGSKFFVRAQARPFKNRKPRNLS